VYESQFEEELYEARRKTLREIGALGQKAGLSYGDATYPNQYVESAPEWDETKGAIIPWVRKKFDAKTTEELEASRVEVSIAGRVMAIRVQGKAGFAQLQQAGQRMQIYVRKDDVGEDGFALYKLLDLGDHVGVKGYLMRTRTGELTVHVTKLTFLAKAMLPLPDKFHGLEDVELRYRRRYLDLFTDTGDWEREMPPPYDMSAMDAPFGGDVAPAAGIPRQIRLPAREVFVKRAAVLRALRTFFDARGYLEVETPMMHTVAGGAAARPFTTHHNALDLDLKLRIAPELYLKRLVVGGMDRVYEINRNFRNEGISTQHNPEFTMLEFYQAYANYHDLMDLTQELVAFVAQEVNGTTFARFTLPKGLRLGEVVEIDLANWQKISMREAIIKWWGGPAGTEPTTASFQSIEGMTDWIKSFNLPDTVGFITKRVSDEARSSEFAAQLAEFAKDHPYETAANLLNEPDNLTKFGFYVMTAAYEYAKVVDGVQPLGKAIATIFEEIAEPHLIQPTIIYDFPLAVSPLSKVKPDEPDWVERFEFYIGGFEVGNAFSELNDPVDQRGRFEAQIEERKRGNIEAMAEVDEDYVRALGYGLPPTAGEGIGIDRLTMILTGSKSIRDVILFPLLRPLGKAE
jgi:lysyl-tRNA synthetase class 2